MLLDPLKPTLVTYQLIFHLIVWLILHNRNRVVMLFIRNKEIKAIMFSALKS